MKRPFSTDIRDIAWPPQCLNFDFTAGAGGFTTGAPAPAVNMLEEALKWIDYLFIVYPVAAAGRSIAKYIRVSNQQKAKGTSSGW